MLLSILFSISLFYNNVKRFELWSVYIAIQTTILYLFINYFFDNREHRT